MLDAFVERQTRTVRGNQILIALRLLLATVSLTVLIIQEIQIVHSGVRLGTQSHLLLRPPGLVAIIVCFLTILYALIARSSRDRGAPAKLAFVQIFVDIFLVSALVWHTGGVSSQFIVLYLISICSAAFVLKWNVSLLAAAASTIIYSLVALLYSMDKIPESFRMQFPSQADRLARLGIVDFLRYLLLPSCAFFLTGLLAGALSRRLAMAKLLHDELLEGIGEGIVVLDTDRRVLYHNQEFVRLLGLPSGPDRLELNQILGATLDKSALEVLSDRTARRIETNHKRPDGTIVPFEVRIIPILDVDSSVSRGLIMALDDISAEKKMEEFLKHRERVETMGHLSATIAHEIRNPLASIRGAVQEIARAVDIPENKKVLLEIVLSESDRLDQIISDFLRFARMRPPKLISTDVGRVLSDVKLLLSSRPEAAHIKFHLSGDEGEPFNADPEQLRQLFLNLGVNAMQAMADSPVKELTLRVRVVSLHNAPGFARDHVLERVNRHGVLVEVQDTGAGISPEANSQIFEPFFTTKATGTGLGLAIVERIVQSHEGMISVESTQNVGTTFRVWLPSDLTVAANVSGFRPVIV